MNHFHISYFFDLTQFQHVDLFKDESCVWKALSQIDSYLASLSLGNIEVEIPDGAYLVDAHLISIGKGTVVEPGAYIKGPCCIGKDCAVRHGAYVRGNVITGDKCVIGHDTEIKQTILLNHAHAAHFAYLGDSIIGNRVNLGAGTKCANLKLDNTSIVIHDQGDHIDTGLRKFGAIIGDDSQIGCNAVTNPGSLLGKHVHCFPVINVGGFIPSHSTVKSTAQLSIVTCGL